jgi:hypothetical protein
MKKKGKPKRNPTALSRVDAGLNWLARDYSPTKEIPITRRYVVGTTNALTISGQSLLLSAGCVCTVASTTLRGLFGAVKLRRVRVWSQPVTSSSSAFGTTVSLTLTFGPVPPTNVFYGANRQQYTATAVGPERPLYIDAVPEKGSNVAGWNMGNTDQLFSLWSSNAVGAIATGVPAGTIIEVDYSVVMGDGAFLGSTYAVVSTAILLGQIGYPTLDNQSTRVCLPVGLNGII